MGAYPNREAEILLAWYAAHDEGPRLSRGIGRVELLRTQELLRAALPPTPARILDVGGADGVHASWLTEDGYHVEIADVVPMHVDRARARGLAARVADARALPHDDESCDAVLLLGPLYHLRERTDRMRALQEARRVLRPHGVLAAAGVSRMAVPLDWLVAGSFGDPAIAAVARRIASVGYDDTGHGAGVFFFHTVGLLEEEVRTAGFTDAAVHGVEGPAWPLLDRTCPPDHPDVARIVEIARLADMDHATAGTSAHLLALGRKSG